MDRYGHLSENDFRRTDLNQILSELVYLPLDEGYRSQSVIRELIELGEMRAAEFYKNH